MSALRIVSFLPAATEMIYLLGLADRLVGRTHECDYPEQVKDKPIIVDCALDLCQMTMAQIDVAVSKQLERCARGLRCGHVIVSTVASSSSDGPRQSHEPSLTHEGTASAAAGNVSRGA
jgi:hypothetical protein